MSVVVVVSELTPADDCAEIGKRNHMHLKNKIINSCYLCHEKNMCCRLLEPRVNIYPSTK